MPELACDLKDIGLADSGCEEEYAGFGQYIYLAWPEDLKAAPEYDPGKAAYTTASFVFKEGKRAYKIRIKKNSAKVSAPGNDGPKGYNQTLTFNIDRDVDTAMEVLRIAKNRGNAIAFAEKRSGGFRVVYDPMSGTDVKNDYESGDAPDSDSGHTVTITCNPAKYPAPSWDGVLTTEPAPAPGG